MRDTSTGLPTLKMSAVRECFISSSFPATEGESRSSFSATLPLVSCAETKKPTDFARTTLRATHVILVEVGVIFL